MSEFQGFREVVLGRSEKIFLSSPHMSDEGFEMDYVREAFDSNWIAPLGPNVDAFEAEFARKVGVPHAAALSSGTAALHLSLRAAGIERGDRVLCSSFTFSASANPIIYEGAVPVFIDSDYETWNMCPEALEEALKKYSPRAVVAVHLYGLSADMDRILELCRDSGTALIEDAAESLGSCYKGKHTGTMGDYGIYSFNSNKIITTSGGGMLVARDKSTLEKVRFWATQSRDPAPYYQHSELGFNYRMSNVLAGIGRGQLMVLDARVAKKKKIFEYYRRELGSVPGIAMMPVNDRDITNCWLSCLTLPPAFEPSAVIEALGRENIEARRVWKPMHLQPFFEEYDFVGKGVSDDLFERGLCLPSDTKMDDRDLEKVCGIVRGVTG